MNGKIKITVEDENETMVLSFSNGCTIEELGRYLKMIPKFLTYSDTLIDEIFYKHEL